MKKGKPIRLYGYTAGVRRVSATYSANTEVEPFLYLSGWTFKLLSAQLRPGGSIEAVYGQQ